MKKIKILICIVLALGTALLVCSAPNVVLANDHTLHTVTGFGFIDHHARVNVDFMGYENTTLLCIDVRIEKLGALFFNRTVFSGSYQMQGESYQDEFFYPIDEDGIYTCNVTYTVKNGDTEDVISFCDTQTYRRSEYTEHTHVWKHTVTEPTCLKGGSDFKFCYCGQSQTTLLPRLAHTPGSPVPELKNNVYCLNCSVLLYTESTQSAPAGQSVAASGNSSGNSSGTSSYIQTSYDLSETQCNCPLCELDRALPDPQPTFPKAPSLPTVDPWKKQQEAYARNNNYLHRLRCYTQ